MPRYNSKTLIGGVDFSACRAVILDGQVFASDYVGSSAQAADGTPHVQRINVGVKGKKFGVRMDYAQASLIQAALFAIKTAEMAQEAIEVWLTDSLYDINVLAYPDYDMGQNWVQHGPESEGIIEGLTMRFIAVAQNIVV